MGPARTSRVQNPGRKENEMADNGKTVTVTDGNFSTEIEQHNGLSLVDFWAAWCGPCRMVGPVIEQLAGEYEGKLKVGKLDVDSNQQTTMRFNVRSIPSILFFKNGQLVDTVVGAVPKQFLERKIQELSAAA
jgi:thioredoxin 1